MSRMALTVAVLFAAISISAAASPPTVSGPVIRLTLPRGWHGSVGFGVERGRPAAWILAASFPIARDAATHEGLPTVPAKRVLVSVGDFPIDTPARARWPRVARLHVARTPTTRHWSAHVRYAKRAVLLTVMFGSAADDQALRAANRVLASARPQR